MAAQKDAMLSLGEQSCLLGLPLQPKNLDCLMDSWTGLSLLGSQAASSLHPTQSGCMGTLPGTWDAKMPSGPELGMFKKASWLRIPHCCVQGRKAA